MIEHSVSKFSVADAEDSSGAVFVFVILIISHMNTPDNFNYSFLVLPIVMDFYAIVRFVVSVMWIMIWLIRLIFWGLD